MMELKPIKIHWVTPSGKQYEDTIKMTQEQYQEFVNNLLKLKKVNN